jgi:hypothetical protein
MNAIAFTREERRLRRVSKDGRESVCCVHPSRRLLRKLLRMRFVTSVILMRAHSTGCQISKGLVGLRNQSRLRA